MAQPKRKLLEQRNELIERYVRRFALRKSGEVGADIGRRLSRPWLKWSDRKRMRALKSAMETTAVQAKKAKMYGFEATEAVLNMALFFLVAECDIQAVKIDALTHPDAWRRNLAARVMLLTIHELDMDKVAGNRLRQALLNSSVPDELRNSVTEAMRAIRRAQSQAKREFAYLRNSTIAHRDPDAVRQYRDIGQINSVDVVKVAAEFYEGTELFMKVMPRLLLYLGSISGLMAQRG